MKTWITRNTILTTMTNTRVRKVPMRKCVVTQERFPKKDLIRVVRTPENEVVVDLSGKLNGHGAYIQKSMETLQKARKTKALDRALETEVGENVYARLEELIHEH